MATDPRRCASNRELISAMLDGELSFDERAQLMNHLVGCPACRALLDEYRAVGTQLRALPAAQAPQELRADIYAATIEAEPRRLFFLSSKLGYSVAALAAVVLLFVVAGYLLIGGYQRGVTPQIENSQPVQGSIWPVNNPIEITFNKPMDHASVESALAIQPDGEEARLDISWRGNTLVIAQTTPLKAGSLYAVRITTAARDQWGHRLESDFALDFGTAPSFALAETPTPQPTTPPAPTATVAVSDMTATTGLPASTATQAPSGPTAPTTSSASSTPATSTSTSSSGNPGTGPTLVPGTIDTPTPLPPPQPPPDTGATDPTATPTQLPIDAVPTATPQPTEAPTLAPAETPTPTAPAPTATETATLAPPTETPVVPTDTPSTIGVTGVLGSVYWANDSVRQRLGEPSAISTSATNEILGFNGGNMYLRGDTNRIYVMVLGGTWDWFTNTATTDPPFASAPDPNFWIPGGAFGVLWSNEPSVQSSLRYALNSSTTSFTGEFQQFSGGVMLSTPTDVLIFYSDGSWDFLPIVNSTGDAAPPP